MITFFTAQQQDAYCKELITKARTDIESGYLISEDVLLYVGQDLGHARLVITEKLTRSIIKLHHERFFSGHQSVKWTRDLIKLNYFWPNMDRDIDTYIKQCDSCAKFKAGRQPTAPLGELPDTTFPFEVTSIDICGPYPDTRRGYRSSYIYRSFQSLPSGYSHTQAGCCYGRTRSCYRDHFAVGLSSDIIIR
jgi:hypothetical protein